jgi:transcription initiation factor IIF auxiliary subunit
MLITRDFYFLLQESPLKLSKYVLGGGEYFMSNINVSEIASRLQELHKPFDIEEIENFVNERFNGKRIPLENIVNETMVMVAELISKTRSQDHKFMVDLVQSVVDEMSKSN